jgi:hypothetical protein
VLGVTVVKKEPGLHLGAISTEVKGTKMSVRSDACRSGSGTSSMFSRRLAALGNVPVPRTPIHAAYVELSMSRR